MMVLDARGAQRDPCRRYHGLPHFNRQDGESRINGPVNVPAV